MNVIKNHNAKSLARHLGGRFAFEINGVSYTGILCCINTFFMGSVFSVKVLVFDKKNIIPIREDVFVDEEVLMIKLMPILNPIEILTDELIKPIEILTDELIKHKMLDELSRRAIPNETSPTGYADIFGYPCVAKVAK